MILDMTDAMGPGKLARHMQNLLYTYDEYLICIGLGPSISSVICKHPSYSSPSNASSPVLPKVCYKQPLIWQRMVFQCIDPTHDRLNPSNAEATFAQSTRMQRLLKAIETLSCYFITVISAASSIWVKTSTLQDPMWRVVSMLELHNLV